MTVRFINYRLALYISVFLLSGTVLGLAGHLASVFLPNLHKDFTIFALIIPALTIFAFMITLQWAQARTEAVVLFILTALWLAMGAWSNDIIGTIQCDSLSGQRVATKNGDMSGQSYCYEMKVIEAFSWMNFVLFAISFIILLALVTQAQKFGRYDIWRDPIKELGWFGEWPGYYNTSPGMPHYPAGGYVPYGVPMQAGTGITQQAGNSIVIQPGVHGQPPTITQVPFGSAIHP
ncbi:uncharacterized protein ARMOST_05341 [Armillaria ostoyae]|uniref:MARVEL domain-containing protein n=2 Tax=Armillaria TaxID=47424 RepID=A0A284QZV6_ARMOS|nr:hypothetical protein ARMSODRAFT_956422 [Armillaria solidipes]SJL02017.1 uncharacterized protein ARMOST_05341 [Armillaria ostoyae]